MLAHPLPSPPAPSGVPRRPFRVLTLALALLSAAAPGAEAPVEAAPAPRRVDIAEYRLEGARQLSQLELEAVLAPYLGPGRVLEDVEKARAAVEKAYSDRGYLAVTVAIPPQRVKDGVVTLAVTEGTVARLRVKGARWFSLTEVKRLAPSVAEGTTPNLDALSRDMVALNVLPDRRVTPELRAGATPGTLEVDLKVQDALPLHGLLEFNNRASAATTPTRLTGSLQYDNLWQQGHSVKLAFQVAPERLDDAKVFSVAYTLRFPAAPWLSATLSGVSQDSDISTLGGTAVAARGWTASGRVAVVLPGSPVYFHTLTAGVDFKRSLQRLTQVGGPTGAPGLTTWPLSAQYGATFQGERSVGQLAATLTVNPRGLGASTADFDERRLHAPANFVHFRLDLSWRERLGNDVELIARANGQLTGDPLLPSEQLIGGGVDSVRGYPEAQAAGDYGGFVSLELRGPSYALLMNGAGTVVNDLRLLAFAEGGWTALWRPLPEQDWVFRLWSAGVGARLKLFQYLNGAVDLGVPLRTEGATTRFVPRFHFRLWLEF